ncbi:MAG: ATP synthase F1 subunit epsilon, partial [Candidatus Marinimicrobia bacterium]|nr:ATP synthase F1 subunit epsilon [Candidatus Neomarinimicrobiota bacterium]
MSDKLEINIITPTSTLEFSEVDYLRAPSTEGLFGVLPGHIASIIALDVGEVKISTDNTSIHFATSGGFADIIDNKVTLVLESAEEASKIDLSRAEKSLDKAQHYLDDKSNDMDRAFKAIKRAKNRISVSRK